MKNKEKIYTVILLIFRTIVFIVAIIFSINLYQEVFGLFRNDLSWGITIRAIFLAYFLFCLALGLLSNILNDPKVLWLIMLLMIIGIAIFFSGSFKIYPNRMLLISSFAAFSYIVPQLLLSKLFARWK